MLSNDIRTFINSLKKMNTFKDQIKNMDISKEYIKHIPEKIYETSVEIESNPSNIWVQKFLQISDANNLSNEAIIIMSIIGIVGIASFYKVIQSKSSTIIIGKHEEINTKSSAIATGKHKETTTTYSIVQFVSNNMGINIINNTIRLIDKYVQTKDANKVKMLQLLSEYETELNNIELPSIINDSKLVKTVIDNIRYMYINVIQLLNVAKSQNKVKFDIFVEIVENLNGIVYNVNYNPPSMFDNLNELFRESICTHFNIFMIPGITKIIVELCYNIHWLKLIKHSNKNILNENYNINFFVQIVGYIINYYGDVGTVKMIPINIMLSILNDISKFVTQGITYEKMKK